MRPASHEAAATRTIASDDRAVLGARVAARKGSGWRGRYYVLLALSLLQGSAELRLLLHLASGDLEQMPRYYEGCTSSPPAGWVDTATVREPGERRADLEAALAIPAEAREYGPETPVLAGEAEGQLVSLAADQYTNRISELRASGLLQQEVVVPERWIGGAARGRDHPYGNERPTRPVGRRPGGPVR